MAKKYIDCEAAIEKLCDRCGECLKAKGKDCAVVRIMDKIPAADVAPVIHAHWTSKDYILDDIYGHWEGTCSNCGQHKRVDNYCPFCGAKMDESEDGE